MERQELEKAYNQYIEELAQDALAKKPVNQNLLNIIDKVQRDIRDLDIVEAMNKIKENTIPQMPSINSIQTSENFTINEFGEIVRGEEMTSPKAAEFGQPMAAQPNYSNDYQHKSR